MKQIAPGPCTDIANLHAILERGIVAIHDSIADYVEEECEHSQEDLRYGLRKYYVVSEVLLINPPIGPCANGCHRRPSSIGT